MYSERWASTEVGKRGGLRCPGTRPHVTVAWKGYFGELLQWYKVTMHEAHRFAMSWNLPCCVSHHLTGNYHC